MDEDCRRWDAMESVDAIHHPCATVSYTFVVRTDDPNNWPIEIKLSTINYLSTDDLHMAVNCLVETVIRGLKPNEVDQFVNNIIYTAESTREEVKKEGTN